VITILALAALVVALGIGYALGRAMRAPAPPAQGVAMPPASAVPPSPAALAPSPSAPPGAPAAAPPAPGSASAADLDGERARIIRSLEAETAALRRALTGRDAALAQAASFAAERRRLFAEVASARAETARYRQIVIDLENNAPPPLLGGPGAPDDLKLIVGVGPVLERMLYQLGITTYRQIANWTERDIDDVDSRLHEFPGRIRRDAWVTQARALYQSKYGAAVPPRDRG
jgi:predicted flap endonuclease-1-like 5' DNA nuclease